jgi:hypothetical protein|tara:strand:+ start:21942 stop:22769 length:828 start_codon:yes stop_codon:yes gene_type:complete
VTISQYRDNSNNTNSTIKASQTEPNNSTNNHTKSMTKPKGFILERGVSPIDGNPFVAVMTLGCKNRKTGPMPTVWILREDISPVEAVATGQDVTNCGDCIHRGVWDPDLEKMVNRSCYVNYGQAPNSVWKAYKRGAYEEDLTVEQGKKYLSNKLIRWGGYGDPAIIDPMIFNSVNGAAAGHTGYTHQWRQPWAQWAREEFQASCDGLADYLDASSHGWKTFSVIPKGSNAYSGKLCPATAPNSQATCNTCALCNGDKTDIYVVAHGSGAKFVTAS